VDILLALSGLFAIAFVAATILPAQSEAAMVGLQLVGYRRWFPVSATSLDRASAWYRRWGRWSLLLSWAPIGGDALTVAAGVLREPFWSFLALVAIAKTGRYIVLAAATSGLTA
jgi:membrane protein YqaA with SNARE-associated domain